VANFPLFVRSTTLNVASQETHGIDVEASYRLPLADVAPSLPGTLDLRLLYTHQPVMNTQSFATSPVVNSAGAIGLAADRASLLIGYEAGPISLRWQARYSGKLKLSGDPLLVFNSPDLPSRWVHDLNVTYRLKVAGSDLQAFVAVSNVFDKEPRMSPGTNFAGSPGSQGATVDGDDEIGRYYTFGLRMQY
jgi:outer membrane receptor protein involved in Fe transport